MKYYIIKTVKCTRFTYHDPLGFIYNRHGIDVNQAFRHANELNSMYTKYKCDCKYEVKELEQ